MNFNRLAQEIHANAVAKGLNAPDETLIVALGHVFDELTEVLDEQEAGHDVAEIYVKHGKPEGVPIELADIIIRVLSYCGKESIDIDSAIRAKMKFNATRTYEGGKL